MMVDFDKMNVHDREILGSILAQLVGKITQSHDGGNSI